jgi:hypothetical protein
VVFGALRRINPAVTNVPLVLLEFDILREICCAVIVALVVGVFIQLTGLIAKPYRIPNTICDREGMNVIVGEM